MKNERYPMPLFLISICAYGINCSIQYMKPDSNIGIWNEDGSLDAIYCYWDGFPTYHGSILFHHYQELDKVRKLIALGDIGLLAPTLEPNPEKRHHGKKPQPGVVVAYMRDWGYTDLYADHLPDMQAYIQYIRRTPRVVANIYIYVLPEKCWYWAPCNHENVPGELRPLTKEMVEKYHTGDR